MDGFSKNAENLKNELMNVRNNSRIIEESQRCDECYKNIFAKEFYIFPSCLHGFHKVIK